MNEIISAIRKKYSQYDDMGDDELSLAIADKYPVYLKDKSFAEDVTRIRNGPPISPEFRPSLKLAPSPDQGAAEALQASPLADIGRGFAAVGKGAVAALADAGDVLVHNAQVAQEERGIPPDPVIGSPVEHAPWENLKAWQESDGIGRLPAEDLRTLPKPFQLIGRGAQGLIEASPKIAATTAAQAAGIPAPIAAGAIFGLTPEGFDVKQGAVAAMLAPLGQMAGKYVEALATKLGVGNDAALNVLNKLGGATAAGAYLKAIDESQIATLPPEQREQARIDSWANIAGQAALGAMGGREQNSKPIDVEVVKPEKGAANAVEERTQPESNQPERAGTETQRVPTETGGGDSTKPVAETASNVPPKEGVRSEPSPAPENKHPDPNWQVTVQAPQEFPGKGTVPGYVQIDKVTGGEKEWWSSNPDKLKALGYELPDLSKLESGKYKLGEINQKTIQQAPAPERFDTIDDLLKFRETRRQEEISLYQSEIGLTKEEAERLQNLMERDADTARFEKWLSEEKRTKLNNFFEESPYNKVGGPFKFWDYDKRYNPEELTSDNSKSDLARSIIQVTQSEIEPSVTSDKYIYAATAIEQFKKKGGTQSDLARELDNYTTRNSGSQGDKYELFKIAGERVTRFLKQQGVTLPEGDLGGRLKLPTAKIEQRGPQGGNVSAMGIFDPATYGLDKFVKNDVAPFLKKGVDAAKAARDILIDWFSPASKAKTGDVDVLFESKGYKEQLMTKAIAALDAAKKQFDGMQPAEQVAFVDRVKTGQKQPAPELQATADLLRQWDDRLYSEVAKYKPGLPYLDNHLRVLWQTIPGSPTARGASAAGIQSKRPWQGSKGFLKKHVLDDMSEGLALGGVPVTYNPVEMFLLHAQDAMKFVAANRAWKALKATGSVEFVKTGAQPPDGYRRISDSIAKPYFKTEEGLLAKSGEWYVEDGAARMIENYLSRDYIRTGKFGPIGKALLGLKNFTTAIELGLSPFHAVFESNEVMGSSLGLGISKMFSGEFKSGLKDIVTAAASPKSTASLGGAAIRYAKDPAQFRATYPEAYDWFTKNYPNAGGMIDDLFMGGGQISMHEDYRIAAQKGFKNAVKQGNYVGAVVRAIPALGELANKPLFETYIPRLKVGMFLREYAFELNRNSDAIASGAMTRPELARKTWSFVEDRFGELNWDNLYWDRTFKSGMQLMFRSVTWKLGNIRGFGKAGRDVWTEGLQPLLKGQAPRVSLPMAWLAGMSVVTALEASIITKAATGKYPWDLAGDDEKELIKNLTFPRIDAQDQSQRVSVPTYWRDFVSAAHSPTKYIQHSLSGEIGRVADMLENKDFYGRPVYNPTDPIDKKVADSIKHLIPLPFGVQSVIAAHKTGATPAQEALGLGGFTKAPGYISPSAHSQIEQVLTDYYKNSNDAALREKAVKRLTQPIVPSDYADLRRTLTGKNTETAQEEYQKLLDSGHKSENIRNAIRPFTAAKIPGTDYYARHDKSLTGNQKEEREFVKSLSPDDRKIYDSAKAERELIWKRFEAMSKQGASPTRPNPR